MADFMNNLWGAVFEAGPTPTLLTATNATFAALQLVLLTLLIATYSIHFIILSVLCSGLWYSINWFAVELLAAQAIETETERFRSKRQHRENRDSGTGDIGDVADDEGEDTEVEMSDKAGMSGSISSLSSEPPSVKRDTIRNNDSTASTEETKTKTLSAGVSLQNSENTARQRIAPRRSGDLSSEISTDSEWEKVDNN